MIDYLKRVSRELDVVVDQKKKDSKYSTKKAILLSIYSKMMRCFNLKNVVNKFEISPKKLGKLSLITSMKQLDNDIMESCAACKRNSESKECRDQLKEVNANNIIDNVLFLVPMSVICDEKHFEKMPIALTYSNVIGSSEHRSELMLAVYEKYDKKASPPQMVKKFKTYMHLYEVARNEFAKYV